MTIQEFRNCNLTKRCRITLEEGKYLGDTADDLGVYSLFDFWVITDEDFSDGSLPSYVCIKSAEAYETKPYIHDEHNDDDEIKLTN